jgi:hypothetical protein
MQSDTSDNDPTLNYLAVKTQLLQAQRGYSPNVCSTRFWLLAQCVFCAFLVARPMCVLRVWNGSLAAVGSLLLVLSLVLDDLGCHLPW